MISFRSLLLNLYYRFQYPGRLLVNAQRAAEGNLPVMVLAYHRVADDRATDWTQSNRSFEKQMRWLKRHFEMVSLAEAQRRIRAGHNSRPTVSVTFDDGYAANCDFAIPFLLAENIPCTYFVTSSVVIDGGTFIHDAHIGKRLAPNTAAQIREMVAAGIEIGNHSLTHPNFGAITDPRRVYREVVVSGEKLADLMGKPVRYFAFPYGHHQNLNASVFGLAKEHGYEAVCSAYGGFNFPGDDAFHLQRIMADEEFVRLKNWMTIDPRKLTSVARFEYREDLMAATEGVLQ